jgi:putative GTP pyrophosphokinase
MRPKLTKSQIDRLGDRLRQGPLVEADLRSPDSYRRSFGEAYETVVRAIREQSQLETTGRPAKSTGSIIEKLRRESIRLTQVQDIAGCRVVVADVPEQERVLKSLRVLFPEAIVIDRRAHPSYGYRAVHIIVRVAGTLVEIQVRTTLQHVWAELSEKFSDELDPSIKYGGGPSEVRKLLAYISEVLAKYEEAEAGVVETGAMLLGAAATLEGPEQVAQLSRLQQEHDATLKNVVELKSTLLTLFNTLTAAAHLFKERKT